MPVDLHTSQYCWIMKPYDSRTLYRQYNILISVDTMTREEININEWVNPNSPKYNKTLADAVFHYTPRAAANEQFEICTATSEMKDVAWKFGHNSQIMLDGTFGVCTRKLLLFITVGIDDKGRGVPLAFMLFSAPSGNKQTSSGYDSGILACLLCKRAALESDFIRSDTIYFR